MFRFQRLILSVVIARQRVRPEVAGPMTAPAGDPVKTELSTGHGISLARGVRITRCPAFAGHDTGAIEASKSQH